jgi:hypothetical protein
VLAYFKQIALDVEATRERILAVREREAGDAAALLGEAEEEAQAARARLARVRDDYTGGELRAAEWRELRAELEPECKAATAQARRLREQLSAARSGDALGAPEQEVVEQLARLGAAIAGDVACSENLDAVRSVLRRLFDRFLFHPAKPRQGEARRLAGSHYWIEPVVREAALAGCGEKVRALLLRKPLEQAKSSQERGSPYCYLFGPIPVGSDCTDSRRAQVERRDAERQRTDTEG